MGIEDKELRASRDSMSGTEYIAKLGTLLSEKIAAANERRRLRRQSQKMDHDFEEAGRPTKGSEPASSYSPDDY